MILSNTLCWMIAFLMKFSVLMIPDSKRHNLSLKGYSLDNIIAV